MFITSFGEQNITYKCCSNFLIHLFIKVLFVSDGPGLAHRDTWEETLSLDESWDDNVRVTTLKTLEEVTHNWL